MLALRVENLGKQYNRGVTGKTYLSLRETIMQTLSNPLQKRRAKHEPFWALQNVSFDIKHGDVVGIIGRNGAGKSTLLKILSRITKPSVGKVYIGGRVGSLLEVGTGFHPELTGRENIFLNGAILGMSRKEIARKFDEIVDFSEIKKFIDTPVKRYSSGMYMRLAFSVAAHLETEILVVDEVLAVGDSNFQKKCLGRMGQVANEGRTVLFVSHNMGAIETLCSSAILLDKGKLLTTGKTSEVINDYLLKVFSADNNNYFDNVNRSGTGRFRVTSFHIEDQSGTQLENGKSGQPLTFVFAFKNDSLTPRDRVSFGFSVSSDREVPIFHYYSHFSEKYYQDLPEAGHIKCTIPGLSLAPGNYLVGCRVVANGDQALGEELDWPQVYIPLTIEASDFYEVGNANLSSWGPILVKGYWS